MIAWLALALAIVAILLWLAVAAALRYIWAKAEPQVRPLLAMFAPAQAVEPEPREPGKL